MRRALHRTPLTLCVAALLTSAGWPRPSAAPAPDRTSLSVKALIGQFTAIRTEQESDVARPARPQTVWDFPQPGGFLVAGSPLPFDSPALAEIRRRGVDALSELLAHLRDERETGIRIEHSGIGGMWHEDEYDFRHTSPKKQPARWVNTVDSHQHPPNIQQYTARVGDVCFRVIGQIVNRELLPIRYQPSACIVLNSPVTHPGLAAAARKDWQGLTRAQHRQSLISDTLDLAEFGERRAPQALALLCYYFPREGEPHAIKLLNRPLHNPRIVELFVDRELLPARTARRRRSLLAAFERRNGSAHARGVFLSLMFYYHIAPLRYGEVFKQRRPTAIGVLKQLYPGVDPFHPPLVAVTDSLHKADLLKAIARFPSKRIDAAAYQAFRSIRLEIYHPADRSATDDLALACMDRLGGASHREEFLAYCTRRIRELEAMKHRENPEEGSLNALRERLEMLAKTE